MWFSCILLSDLGRKSTVFLGVSKGYIKKTSCLLELIFCSLLTHKFVCSGNCVVLSFRNRSILFNDACCVHWQWRWRTTSRLQITVFLNNTESVNLYMGGFLFKISGIRSNPVINGTLFCSVHNITRYTRLVVSFRQSAINTFAHKKDAKNTEQNEIYRPARTIYKSFWLI